MSTADDNVLPDQQIRLRLTTRESDIALDDTTPILVPTTFRRYQLSTLINGLLEKEKTIPLEFLINGTYLRTSLDAFLTDNGISAETTLAVEYVRARIPPQHVASFQHDDWVSDVDVLSSSSAVMKNVENNPASFRTKILTASYDSRLRIWDTSANVLATSPGLSEGGHASFIKSAKFISASRIASASADRTVRVWSYKANDEESSQISPQLELYGHTGAVESVASDLSSSKLLSASSDNTVGLWSTRKSDAPAAPESLLPKVVTKEGKKRKLNPSVSVPRRGPLALMHAHTAPVSDAIFDINDATVGYSVSQDHTVRTWDLVTSALVDTRTTNVVLYCITQMPELQLLACGSAGRDIKLVDPRTSASTVTAMTMRGHRNQVVTLSRDQGSHYGLVSGSHDGSCRVWDVRSTTKGKDGVTGQSMFTIPRESLKGKPGSSTGEGVKVFGVCWDQEIGILSAGEDKVVQINSSDSVS